MGQTMMGRREWLRGIAGVAVAGMQLGTRELSKAEAAGGVVRVVDSAGTWSVAAKAAYYDGFEKETGIRVLAAMGQTAGTAQLRVMVQAARPEVDVYEMGMRNLLQVGDEGLLEPVDYSLIDTHDFLPGTTHKYALGVDATAAVITYNHKKFGVAGGPKSWADFWDVKQFPGRRGMGNRAYSQLEVALLADGVAADKLYPLDVERAFRKLDQLKSQIVWWTTTPQQEQLLVNEDVDMMLGTCGRIQTAIEKGAPYTIIWNQGIVSYEGWGVLKGAANRTEAMKFLAYTARPKAQAVFTQYMPYGPVNKKAYEFIPAERAKVLPTYAENMKQMMMADEAWWAKYGKAVDQRWIEWRVA